MSDIRESGWIENESDVILGLYRDGYYYPNTREPDVIEIIVLKAKEGSVGTIKARFVPEFMRFEDLNQ
jgi:replicative DNA helicase